MIVRYSEELSDTICERLMEGESMRKICSSENMPSRATILRWMNEIPEFDAKCARARVLQADLMDDLIADAAEDCDEDNYQSTKVKISAWQWRASKLAPKKYGEKLAHTGADGDGPVQFVVTRADRR